MIPAKKTGFVVLILALAHPLAVRAAFDLTVDQSSLQFGPADAGSETVPLTLNCSVHSDPAAPWTLALQGSPPTHSDGITAFPSGDFLYRFGEQHAGQENPPYGSESAVPSVQTTIYVADPGEYDVQSLPLSLQFRLIVDPKQKTGDYSTTLSLTLVSGE